MRSRTKNIWKLVGMALGLAVLGLQAWPVDRSNPEVTGDIGHLGGAPADVHAILKRSCYDCHSNETVWPWYAYVAPVSWWVADHVHEGRKELNFSKWDEYSDGARAHKLRECWESIEEGEMPHEDYLTLHAEAALSTSDRATLKKWIAEVAPRRKKRKKSSDDEKAEKGHDDDDDEDDGEDEHGEDDDDDDD